MTRPSAYARAVFAHGGDEGAAREARRLLRRIDAAAEWAKETSVTVSLDGANARRRVEAAIAAGAREALLHELDALQDQILEARRRCDPTSRLALILFTDEREWGRYRDALRRDEHRERLAAA